MLTPMPWRAQRSMKENDILNSKLGILYSASSLIAHRSSLLFMLMKYYIFFSLFALTSYKLINNLNSDPIGVFCFEYRTERKPIEPDAVRTVEGNTDLLPQFISQQPICFHKASFYQDLHLNLPLPLA